MGYGQAWWPLLPHTKDGSFLALISSYKCVFLDLFVRLFWGSQAAANSEIVMCVHVGGQAMMHGAQSYETQNMHSLFS